MKRNRFEFALANVKSSMWESFEELASAFLADEYPELRTLAGVGDRGRDAILLQSQDYPTVIIQYSLREDWQAKIRESATQVRHEFPQSQVLIYVTNQKIGPKADASRSQIGQDHGLFLDVRDRTWFLERQNRSLATVSAAEEFSDPILGPLLASDVLIQTGSHTLTEGEAGAAITFLSMKWEDSSRNKGLTKLSFEALAIAALRHTDNDSRLSRTTVCESVRAMIQSESPEIIDQYTNAALDRLKKRRIRHWQQEDEFCLSYYERQQRDRALVERGLLDDNLENEILNILGQSSKALDHSMDDKSLQPLIPVVRDVLGEYLLQRGEMFAQSLSNKNMIVSSQEEIESICINQIDKHQVSEFDASDIVPLISNAIEQVLVRPSSNVQRYLRALADGYTLFAFLRQVPDVQRAMQKIFSNGRIWLDTSAALPLFAEMLLDEEQRNCTRTLRIARQAGMKLFITRGVLDELYYHIRHSRKCQQMGPAWRSRTPFLYSAYLLSGRSSHDFRRWTVEFMGNNRPIADIAEFLRDVADIEEHPLADQIENVDSDFRWAADAYWRSVHVGRSLAYDGSRDPEVASQLADHDIENFLGVIGARTNETGASAFSYEHWWLTLDRRAYDATKDISHTDGLEEYDSPVMSYDFLFDYLTFGPQRNEVSKSDGRLLPLMLDMSMFEDVPSDILDIADTTREEMRGLSDRLIRREIRDRLDAAKLRRGRMASRGMEEIEREIYNALRSSRS